MAHAHPWTVFIVPTDARTTPPEPPMVTVVKHMQMGMRMLVHILR